MINATDCSRLDALIRQGDVTEARLALEALNLRKVPREIMARVAELCRRTGLFRHSVRLLNPIVRAETVLARPATEDELAEYAMALIKLGAVKEGRQILSAIDFAKEPKALLYHALSYFPDWEYANAVAPLETYLRSAGADPYLAMIARVNLAAAYLGSAEFERADALIRKGLEMTEAKKLLLLRGNFLELGSQLAFKQERYDVSLQCLEKAKALLDQSGLYDGLYVEKWRAIVDGYRHRGGPAALTRLREARAKAEAFGHWETVRDLDLHLAKIRSDSDLFHHLHHGTPHAGFRRMLMDHLRELGTPPSRYQWRIGPGDAPRILDVRTGHIDGADTQLLSARSLHALLKALVADFYRPARVAALASAVFPDEYFHPETTPNRIHQLIKRLRSWSAENQIGLDIAEADGWYRIGASGPLTIATIDEIAPQARVLKFAKQLEVLEGKKRSEVFTSQEAADHLGCSLSTATRILREAASAGLVERIGSTAKCRYRFSSGKAA